MSARAKDVGALLAILRDENARERDRTRAQKIRAPEKLPGRVPTLDGGGRPFSPMLRARFAFAGRWENAILGQTWLSASEMARATKRAAFRKEVALRRESWTHSIVAKRPLDRLTLFAIDADDGDATYLVWGPSAEPKVLQFAGASETLYANLAAYLDAHLGQVVRMRGSTGRPAPSEDLASYLEDDGRRLDLWVGGLERWGQPIVARAAIATARLVLSSLPPAARKKVAGVLETAARWADDGRGELPGSFAYALNAARPVAPTIEGIENSLHHLDGSIDAVLAAMPPARALSFVEVALFCVVTHFPFREVMDVTPWTRLGDFCQRFGERESARATAYRFDAA